jgi:CRISPR/Cas system-associated exonuclease Cas4 (RecB family)
MSLLVHPNHTTHRNGMAGTRDYLSFSAISLFAACPLRYYFKYIAGLPEKTISASAVFGSCMHRAVQFHFEQLLAGRSRPDIRTLMAVFQEGWQDTLDLNVRFAKGEHRDTVTQLAERMLRQFQESPFAQPTGTVIGVEETLRGELIPGLPDLLCRVDLIVETDDSLIVSDFKTARRSWSVDRISDASAQLLLYSELVKPLADGKPLRLQFAVQTKAKIPEFAIHPVPIDQRQLERTKLIFERVWRSIEAGQFYPNPSAINCPNCPYRVPCRSWCG